MDSTWNKRTDRSLPHILLACVCIHIRPKTSENATWRGLVRLMSISSCIASTGSFAKKINKIEYAVQLLRSVYARGFELFCLFLFSFLSNLFCKVMLRAFSYVFWFAWTSLSNQGWTLALACNCSCNLLHCMPLNDPTLSVRAFEESILVPLYIYGNVLNVAGVV